MKIAIFHDFFGSIGGGEKLVLELAKALNADIITAEVNKDNLKKINKNIDIINFKNINLIKKINKNNLNNKKIKVINIGDCVTIPILKHIQASFRFFNAKFLMYDFYVMSGCWSMFAAKKHKPNLYYCHTPVRMFYDAYKDFYKQAPWWGKWIFVLWVKIHSIFLEKNIKYINKIITNSKNTQKRIKKYYKRDSEVVYPPIKQYKFRKYGDFWLSVNRLYPHKRIELQFDVFRRLPNEKLVIVGGIASGDHAGSYLKRIMKKVPKNVEIIGEVDEKELERLYGECKGFLTTSKDEDFGMTVLEAMSAGKAVVAVNEGGYKESVIDGKSGYLVEVNVDSIVDAIKKINKNPKRYREGCEKQSMRFSVKNFVEKTKHTIENQNP